MSQESKVHLPLRVPEEYIQRLDDLAEAMGLDRSEVARRALRNGIDDLESGEKMATNRAMEKLMLFTTLLESDPEERAEMGRVIRNLAKAGRKKKGKGKKSPRNA